MASPATKDNEIDFSGHLRELRTHLVGKQATLAEALGVTESAISRWESGKRLPGRVQFPRLFGVLAAAGASALDLESLERTWETAWSARWALFG